MNNFPLLGCLRLALLIAFHVLVSSVSLNVIRGAGAGSQSSKASSEHCVYDVCLMLSLCTEVNVISNSDWHAQCLRPLELYESQGHRNCSTLKYLQSKIKWVHDVEF